MTLVYSPWWAAEPQGSNDLHTSAIKQRTHSWIELSVRWVTEVFCKRDQPSRKASLIVPRGLSRPTGRHSYHKFRHRAPNTGAYGGEEWYYTSSGLKLQSDLSPDF